MRKVGTGTIAGMDRNDTFVLGVDLDGVCADYTAGFRTLVAEATGQDEAALGEQTDWEFTNCGWGIRDMAHYQELHRWAVCEKRMFATLPAIAGASDTLWSLSNKGVYIRIITHRLCVNWGHEIAVADTVAWLQQPRPDGRPLIPYRDICFMANKTDVGADLYIDDAVHNIVNLRREHLSAVTFDTPYNRELPGMRAHGWAEVEHIVDERLAERAALAEFLSR